MKAVSVEGRNQLTVREGRVPGWCSIQTVRGRARLPLDHLNKRIQAGEKEMG